MSPKNGFSINSAHFHLVSSDISPALQLTLKIASFITSRTLSEMCFMQQRKHWEQTGVMNNCEEPTEDHSKLGIERTISPLFRRGLCFEQISKYHKLETNTSSLKAHFSRKQFKTLFIALLFGFSLLIVY